MATSNQVSTHKKTRRRSPTPWTAEAAILRGPKARTAPQVGQRYPFKHFDFPRPSSLSVIHPLPLVGGKLDSDPVRWIKIEIRIKIKISKHDRRSRPRAVNGCPFPPFYPSMKLGYNTNGLAHHDSIEGLELLADIGYRSVAITIDHGWLAPGSDRFDEQLARIRDCLARTGMSNVIETGARFLLNPRIKHFPTLLDPKPDNVDRRIGFLKHCVDTAVALNSECVSLWSGARHESMNDQQALDALEKNLRPVLEYASERDVWIGFEPEPGMFIDTLASFDRMLQWIDAPNLKLTLDIGHLFCQGEVPIVDYIQRWRDRIVNVHIEDTRAGVHEHLMFGEGQIHFPPVIESLIDIQYQGGLHVELSRHSHDAAQIAQRSYTFLDSIIRQIHNARSA